MAQDAGARVRTEALCLSRGTRPRGAVEHPESPRFPGSACLFRDTTVTLPRLPAGPRAAGLEARCPCDTKIKARPTLAHNMHLSGRKEMNIAGATARSICNAVLREATIPCHVRG